MFVFLSRKINGFLRLYGNKIAKNRIFTFCVYKKCVIFQYVRTKYPTICKTALQIEKQKARSDKWQKICSARREKPSAAVDLHIFI